MIVEPYPSDVAVSGPDAPKCEQIEDLIRLLVTIHHRWGNTAVQYRVTWGGSALWAADALRTKIERLRAALIVARQHMRLSDDPASHEFTSFESALAGVNEELNRDESA